MCSDSTAGAKVAAAVAAAAAPAITAAATMHVLTPRVLPVGVCCKRSETKAKAEKRNPYSRHYAFKGRGRKEHLRADTKLDRSELVPARGSS